MLKLLIIGQQDYVYKNLIPLIDYTQAAVSCISAKSSTELIKTKIIYLQPDVLIADIDQVGFDAFALLDALTVYRFKVIFISHQQMGCYRALKYKVNDYILKENIEQQMLASIYKLGKSSKAKPRSTNRFPNMKITSRNISINTSAGILFFDKEKIIRIEACRSYSCIYLSNGTKTTVSKSLRQMVDMLSNRDYFRIHHSHLINRHYIDMIRYQDGGYVLMKDGSHIPIARRRKQHLISFMTA